MKYIADCPGGICKLDETELRRVNGTSKIKTFRMCCYHGGIVTAVEKECAWCGDIFQTKINKRIRICQKCKDNLELEKKAKADLRSKIKYAKAKKKEIPIKTKPVFKKVKKKLPAVRAKTKYEKFCMGPRRGYCKKALTCTELDCGKCDGFVACFGQYDPAKLPVIGKNLR